MDPVILKRHTIRSEESAAPQLASGKKVAPKVRTLVVDGIVRSVEVTCACGETTTIELVVSEEQQKQASQQHHGGSK